MALGKGGRPLTPLSWVLVVCAGAALAVNACGARGEPLGDRQSLWVPLPVRPDAGADFCLAPSDCVSDDLCRPRRCVDQRCVTEPVVCDDGDACTEDVCNPASGLCVFVPFTVDRDGDGFAPPRPGFSRSDPAACGSDCDDTSAAAFPGNAEVCDGVDNDCDGIIDNGARFVADPSRVLHLSSAAEHASGGSVAYGDGAYGVVFSQKRVDARNTQNTFARIAPGGSQAAAQPLALVPSDTYAGPIVWTGQIFATVWEDRRDDDYEIYFNRMNAAGEKLGPDLRLTAAPGFSLRPSLSYDGVGELRVAWDDRRDGGGRSVIYGQRVSLTGEPIGENVALTPREFEALAPVLASGEQRLGMVFMARTGQRRVSFRSFAHDFSDPRAIVPVSDAGAAAPSIVYNRTPAGGRFVVAWHFEGPDGRPGFDIRGSVLGESGEVVIDERALTEPAEFARSHALLALGDRLLLFWSQWVDGRYDLFARELSADLVPLGPAERVTAVQTQAYAPAAALGRDGEIGIVFTASSADDGRPHVYFSSLSCASAVQP